MTTLRNEHLLAQLGYQEYQDYAASLGPDAAIRDISLAKQYQSPLSSFPWQHAYQMRKTTYSGILLANSGEVLEFPNAIFYPAFNLREGTLLRGEISAWINVLEQL